MLSKVFLILIVVVFNMVKCDASVLVPCSDVKMIVEDLKLSLNPADPTSGNNYTINISFTLPETVDDISSGTMEILASLNGFPLGKTDKKLCDEIECPISIGFHEYSWEGQVPTSVHGQLKFHEEWFTDDDRDILCFDAYYDL